MARGTQHARERLPDRPIRERATLVAETRASLQPGVEIHPGRAGDDSLERLRDEIAG